MKDAVRGDATAACNLMTQRAQQEIGAAPFAGTCRRAIAEAGESSTAADRKEAKYLKVRKVHYQGWDRATISGRDCITPAGASEESDDTTYYFKLRNMQWLIDYMRNL